MNNTLSNLNLEIEKGISSAKTLEELYQLLSTYNAYSILLIKAKNKLERLGTAFKGDYDYSDCYKNSIKELFSKFNQNELLNLTEAEYNFLIDAKDMIFLINDHTLLQIHSYDLFDADGLRDLNYKFIKFEDCIVKRYEDKIYKRDPYYCSEYYKYKDAIGLFRGKDLITPAYNFEKQFESIDGADIRDVLIPQSIDEIHEKIKSVKDAKMKILKKL